MTLSLIWTFETLYAGSEQGQKHDKEDMILCYISD